MWKLALSILLLVVPRVFAQLDSHTLTVLATRSINLKPDQAVFGLSVISGDSTTLDQVVSALPDLGITSANLTGFNSSIPPTLEWDFTLAAPLSNLTITIGSLAKLQQTSAQNNSGLTLTFSVGGTEVSQQQRQSQSCSNSDLIADAKAEGQKLAAAAGFTLGPVLKLSNAPLLEAPVPESIVLGAYPLGSLSGFLVSSSSPPVTCSLFVEFRLLP